MARILQFIIFLSIFFIVYFGIHFYVFTRLSSLLEIKRGLAFYLTMAAFAFSFPVASFIERATNGPIARVLYVSSSTWLGVVFLLFWAIIFYEVISLILKIDHKTAGIFIIILVTIVSIFALFSGRDIKVNSIEIPIKGLEKELHIVQLSDIHIGPINREGYMKKIANKVNMLKPDAVLITGDLVDGEGGLSKESVDVLDGINAKKFFVIGNHERYAGVETIISKLKDTDIIILRNEVFEFKGVQIIGIDDPQNEFSSENTVIRSINFNSEKPSLLMYHRPTGIDDAVKKGVSIQLSGHTHNGQIFPFNFFVLPFYKYINGLHSYKGMWIYVSPGTGTWGPPMRLGSLNEITYITLKPA
ncbi:MAG: metallophosphoesterase [Candidatus Woesearchaeota archaeon]